MSFEHFKEWLFKTRMARFPMLTVLLFTLMLWAFWHFDPDFVRYFINRFKPVSE